MTDWATQALQQTADDEAREKENTQAWVTHHAILREEAPLRWEELKTTMRKQIETYKTQRPRTLDYAEVFAEVGTEHVQLSSRITHRTVDITYYSNNPKVIYKVFEERSPSIHEMMSEEGAYSFVRDKSDKGFDEVWFSKDDKRLTIPKVATHLLNFLIK